MTEPKAMREIHEIRERIYEETKEMNAKELSEYYRKGVTSFLADSGYILVPTGNGTYHLKKSTKAV